MKTTNNDKEQKIIKTCTYTITVEITEDGHHIMSRKNDGFNIMELLGFANLISIELLEQLRNEYKPDIIKRTVVID